MNRWALYDDLIDGMDDSVTCLSVTCGHTWTEVRSDAGTSGIAMTTSGETRPRTSIGYRGKTLKSLAPLVKSWNFLEASVGMAAINAYYNSEERMKAFGWEQKDQRFCTFDIDLKGKKVGVVGHLRHVEENLREASEVCVLEMETRDGDYPASACEFLLPECEIVLITGSALINKTMPRLLEICRDSYVIVTGPTVPMTDILVRQHGVDRAAGFIPENREGLHGFVAAGCCGSPYRYGHRFVIDR